MINTMHREHGTAQLETVDHGTSKYTILTASGSNNRTRRHDVSSNNYSKSGRPTYGLGQTKFFLLTAIFLLLSTHMRCISSAALDQLGSSEEVSTSSDKANDYKYCHLPTPCGWAVYIPFTRRVDYFMKNTCVCPPDKACLKADNDLSVSAYVYRCGEKTATTEIDSYTIHPIY